MIYLSKEYKESIFSIHGKQAADTGSPESQIALFSSRIRHITDHLKTNKKDFAARLGLVKLVGKRRRFLSYLRNDDISRYREIIKKLELRK